MTKSVSKDKDGWSNYYYDDVSCAAMEVYDETSCVVLYVWK